MSCGDNILYNHTHATEIMNKNGNRDVKNVLIKIARQPTHLQIKLRDVNDFSFNFASDVDWSAFESMKADQCLEICYDEFHAQLIELLKQTLSGEMLLRIECRDVGCKMIFYERSRIKALVFLVVNLNLTNQKEIIEEMSSNIAQLKEINHGVNSQITSLKCELQDKEMLLDTALTTNHHLEKRFLQDIRCIEEAFLKNLVRIENIISSKIDALFKKHLKLVKDVDVLKRGSEFREALYSQTLLDLDKSRSDSLQHRCLIDELQREINTLNIVKTQNEATLGDHRKEITNNLREIDTLSATINELRRDNLEAAKAIAQKTRTHDEIARDLVQANTMLVNFTNQCSVMSKEIEQLKQIVTAQERTVENWEAQMKRVDEDFEEYKKRYNEESEGLLRTDLFKAKSRLEDLEKQNREAVKINTLLTKKLANGDGFGNLNFTHPK